jgi:hypothetical protein
MTMLFTQSQTIAAAAGQAGGDVVAQNPQGNCAGRGWTS